ncbi:hypothetical protein OG455_04360 [Kitasatospora sp. NBC_01287]|uniref:hypothetical protein n=1 Tax=Kitasatospora sp. NBC_01287 TaxID=2903573 RepID=UPI002259DE77|nr:hypothetical protein [Kitasatospora sp. NBC_01287]MCX4744759.1 hypothetical protein [Kitasatospora sp. NBC_01287]
MTLVAVALVTLIALPALPAYRRLGGHPPEGRTAGAAAPLARSICGAHDGERATIPMAGANPEDHREQTDRRRIRRIGRTRGRSGRGRS